MPVVVRARGMQTHRDAEFNVFGRSGEKRKRGALVLEGESASNSAIGYEGVEETGTKYCLLTKDKKTGRVELAEVPLFEVDSFVKQLRVQDADLAIRQSGVQNWQQRTALGEAFGTKKAKSAINDVQRNRLDADMLDGLEQAIVDNVKERTVQIPSAAQRKQAAEAERPIPAFNAETTVVADIFPLNGVVPDSELDQFQPFVQECVDAGVEECLQKLPFGESDFINARVEQVFAEGENVKNRLVVLVYLSFLRAIYQHRRASSRQQLMEKVGRFPLAVYDGVLERFTVPRAGRFGQSKERSFVVDPYHTDKLLCYMLVLALHANNFQLDVTPLAHELSLRTSKLVVLLRNLGCISRPVTSSEAAARGLSGSQLQSYKIAMLEAPLKLPEVARRRQ